MDFRITGNDVDIMLMQLDQYEDLNLDTERIQQTLGDNDGDMRMALQIIYRLLPKEYNEGGDDDDGEYSAYDPGPSSGAAYVASGNDNTSKAPRSVVSREQNQQMRQLLSNDDNPVLALLKTQESKKEGSIDFLKDDPDTMTRGRKIALYFMKYKLYYPNSDGTSKLEKKEPIKEEGSDDESEEEEKGFKENPTEKSIAKSKLKKLGLNFK